MDSKAKAHLWLQLHSEFQFQSENKTLDQVCTLAIDLLCTLPHFTRLSIYWLRGDILESFDCHTGSSTKHTKIPVGKEIFGTPVTEFKEMNADDIIQSDQYSACSTENNAEIVTLIKDPKGIVLGQINIESDDIGAFNWLDRTNMEIMASRLGEQRILSQAQIKNQA